MVLEELRNEKSQRSIVYIDDPMPLLGHIAFGIIDRGTNMIQVRPYSACHLSCIFCSVDAGPFSKSRITEFIVNEDHLLNWFIYTIQFKKSKKIHVLLDGVGEPLLHPKIEDIIHKLRSIERVGEIIAETHGAVLSEKFIEKLKSAGLSRLNISIDSLKKEKASMLAGAKWYDVTRVAEMAIYANSIGIDVMITPVIIPGLNEEDIEEIIIWASKNIKNKNSPILGIQKYIAHKRGRKVEGIKPMKWGEFYSYLSKLEDKYGLKLIISDIDEISTDERVPIVFEKGDKVSAKIYSRGWLRGELLGYAKGRAIAILTGRINVNLNIAIETRVKILSNKDGIYIAKPA